MNAGSTDALGLLFDRYFARAHQVAIAVCRSRELAEEVVQDAFEGVWRSRATYREGRGPVGAWAMSIVRNRALDVSRRRGRRLVWTASAMPEESSRQDPLPENLVAREDAQHLRDVLGRIPPTQSEVITLAFYGQLSHSEIAEHLQLPPGTVKGRMRLGLDKLRNDLETSGS